MGGGGVLSMLSYDIILRYNITCILCFIGYDEDVCN